MRSLLGTMLAFALVGTPGCARPMPPSPPAPVVVPPDRPFSLNGDEERRRLYSMLEPCRVRALMSYPQAKARFVRGLPPGHLFMVTTRLADAQDHQEQVFVEVVAVQSDSVFGRLATDVQAVRGFSNGQQLVIHESQLVDWTIVRPDGSEEGNLMGKYLDALQDTGRPPAGVCSGEA